jgi:exoribonuclease R
MIGLMSHPDPNAEKYTQLAAQAGDLSYEIELRKAHRQQLYLQMDACRKKAADDAIAKLKVEQAKAEAEAVADQAGA